MRYLHLLVEGQTEESLSDALLRPYFATAGWAVSSLGLSQLRAQCPHLDAWLKRVADWPNRPA